MFNPDKPIAFFVTDEEEVVDKDGTIIERDAAVPGPPERTEDR